MNCEQIREASETGVLQDAVRRHLTGCSDCAEWSSLLKLLGTQPRVKAPADFDTRLQARLASEEVKLLALVNSLPPVKAPADFDFRLRWRLAQVLAEKAVRNPLAWLAEAWANSFSLGQAATALAAVALIVAFSAVQLTRNHNQPAATDSAIAQVDADKTHASVPSIQPADTTPLVRVQPAQATARATRQAMPTAKGFMTTPASDKLVASNASEQYVFDSVKRQETKMPRGRFAYGLQLAKYGSVPKAEPASETF